MCCSLIMVLARLDIQKVSQNYHQFLYPTNIYVYTYDI
ncbi:MAG: hypothetical protein RL757_3398 [Bacteroidota bacterium]|jgi:hypothetical protein